MYTPIYILQSGFPSMEYGIDILFYYFSQFRYTYGIVKSQTTYMFVSKMRN